MLQVDLVANAGSRRDNAEVAECLGAPAQELVPLAVPLELQLDVFLERVGTTERIHHDRVIDHKVDGG